MAYIYKIENDVNNKLYVGKTEGDINKRFKEHCRDARRRCYENRPLYAAMRKYGSEHFHVSLIEETDAPEEREKYWIDKLSTYADGYNATIGGDGKRIYDYDEILGHLIFNPDADVVAKEVGCSRDTVVTVANQHGIDVKKDVYKNFGDINLMRRKRVIAYSSDNDVFLFESIAEAAEWLFDIGATKSKSKSVISHISSCAKGNGDTAYGYRWVFS